MKRLLMLVLFLGCAAGQLGAQVLPPWLMPYPGTTPQNKRTDTIVESSYSVAALPKQVLAHFQKLFDEQGIPIDSIGAAEGFYLHAEAPECNLDISIVCGAKDTAVKVTCMSKVGAVPQVVIVAAGDQGNQEQADVAKKLDKLAAGGAAGAKAAFTWPAWLVRVDGGRLTAQKLAEELKSSFTAAGSSKDILSFYTDLLNANNYQVTESLPTGPGDYGNSLQGSSDPDAKTGRKTLIRIRIKPAGPNSHVEITMR